MGLLELVEADEFALGEEFVNDFFFQCVDDEDDILSQQEHSLIHNNWILEVVHILMNFSKSSLLWGTVMKSVVLNFWNWVSVSKFVEVVCLSNGAVFELEGDGLVEPRKDLLKFLDLLRVDSRTEVFNDL